MVTNDAPKRVISLLGAASETLFRLGVGDKLVGRSHECDYPPALLPLPCISRPRLDVDASSLDIDNAVRNLSASGEAVYKLDDASIAELKPDLLIAQDHCRVCAVTPEDVAQSATCSNLRQLVLRPATLQDCLEDITTIATAMGVPERGIRLRRTLDDRIHRVKEVVGEMQEAGSTLRPRVALLEWCNPIMGCGYWLPELVDVAGGTALHCPPPGGATPSISLDALLASEPDVVIFALCGFGLSRAANEIMQSWTTDQLDQLRACCQGRIFVCDGNYLINRSGPRVVESCEAIAEAIHPALQGHFNHYGTEHLATLDAAMDLAKAGVQTGSKKVRPAPSDEATNSVPPVEQLPSGSPEDALRTQLECLRINNMAGAFCMNSVANQGRWCDAGRFKHVMKSHDTFCRLLSERTTVVDSAVQNGIATAVVRLPEKDGKVAELVWTMVSEVPPKATSEQPVWRTEKVAVSQKKKIMRRDRQSAFPMVDVDEAMATVLQQAEALPACSVGLYDIPPGSILAADAVAPDPLPPFPASTMDGYAVIAADGEGVLDVVGRIVAGVDPSTVELKPGQCAYITTGAMVPKGADAVVKVEDTEAVDGDAKTFDADEKQVRILKGVKAGASIRPVGHDIQQGEVVLRAGDTIQAAEIGLLATVGLGEVDIVPSPIVGIMSTGDELQEPGQQQQQQEGGAGLAKGSIRDSNRSTLLAAVQQLGGVPKDLGIIRDKTNSLREALIAAVSSCDIVISSGGVSMGEADLLKPLLEELGTLHFGRVKMKPGKPTTFATVPVPGEPDSKKGGRSCLVFALPGNPVSCLVTTHLFVELAVKRLRGYSVAECMHQQLNVKVSATLRLDPERAEYHRAFVSWDGQSSSFSAVSTGSQMSSRLLSAKSANALLCLPARSGVVEKGQEVTALLIGNLPAPQPGTCYHKKAAAVGTSAAAGQSYISFPSTGEAGGGESPSEGRGGKACKARHSHDHSHDPHAHGNSGGGGGGGKKTMVRVCLLTISDRASRGEYEDLSGPCMRDLLAAGDLPFQAVVVGESVVPDERDQIDAIVRHWADGKRCDLILTSGGTGFSPRDVTPEAIKPLLHREAPGLVLALYNGGLKHTPMAVLSRPVAGTRFDSLIVTLPGSVKAIKENLASIVPLLPRIIRLIRGDACS